MSFFLERKGRALSDKSQNGEGSTKHRENTASASLFPDDVLVTVSIHLNGLIN